MKEYIVIKDILNIRNKPSDKDDNFFVGQLLRGDTVWLDDTEIIGEIPKGGITNVWKPLDSSRLIANDGIKELTWEAKKELLIQDLKKFWEKSKGSGISTAVMDSGILSNPPEFSTEIVKKFSSDNQVPLDPHGTRIAGIMCGSKINEIIGFAPETQLFDYKFFNNNETNVNKNFINALKNIELTSEIKIVNLSIEFFDGIFSQNETNDIEEIFVNLISQGKIIVAATGNNRSHLSASVKFPGKSENVITVGAIRNNQAVNFPNGIDLSDFTRDPDCFIEMDEWNLFNNDGVFESSNEINSSETTAVMTSLISLKTSINKNLKQGDIKDYIKRSSELFEVKGSLKVYKLNISNFLKL